MHLNRMFLARVFALSMTLWSLPATGFSQDSDSCDEQLLKYCRGDGNTYQEAKGYMECLKRNRNKLSGECGTYVDEVLGEFERSQPCMEDYLRLCGIDLVKMRIKDPQQSYMETMQQCMIMKWDEFSEACRREYQDSMEAVGWDEEAIRKESSRLKAREKARGLVWVKGVLKPVMAEAREGDLIWYKATVRQKKVLDRYPFCPEVKGMKVENAWRKGDCFYKVTAPWGERVIEDLRKSDMLEQITNWGVRRQRLIETSQTIRKIFEKYTSNCPELFELDVTNYEASKQQIVMCAGKPSYDTCRTGYIKSSYDYGYFGCVKYASCEETNPRYIKAGDGCIECEAGGCVDYERWAELGVGTICRVNYKDPSRTPTCKPYQE